MRSILYCSIIVLTSLNLHAQILTDITSSATPIDGINTAINATTGVEINQQNQYPPVNETDSNVNSSDQVFNNIAYAGLTGLHAATAHMGVTELTVNFALFYDGGWFGVNGHDSLNDEEIASSGTMQAPLTSGDVNAMNLPTMQITTNGTTWSNVSYTSNYVDKLVGLYHYNETITPVVTFTLNTPEFGIDGIRLIGTTGGTSDFLGVSDIHALAETPEPSTYALMLGGLSFLVFLARRKSVSLRA